MLRDLNDAWGWILRLVRRVERVETGAFLENSSITEGRMRFIGGLLRVDSGGRVEIVGTLEIDGTTTVTGTFKVDGPWELNGNGKIAGNVNQTGNTTLTGDINVTGGGRVKVGSMTLDPTISDGAMTFSNGAQVFTDASTIQVYKGNGVVQISDTEAKLQLGGKTVRLTSSTVQILGLPTKTSASVGGLPAGDVHADATGNLFRVTA